MKIGQRVIDPNGDIGIIIGKSKSKPRWVIRYETVNFEPMAFLEEELMEIEKL